MTLELWLFGVQVMCFTIGASDAGDDEAGDSGYTQSTIVGFTAVHDVPPDVPGVDRNNGWGDEE